MAINSPSKDNVTSPFMLLLWLKFRLIRGAFKRDKSTIIGTIFMLVIFVPLSLVGAFMAYKFTASSPALAPFILRDILAAAYLVWILTPLFGFSMNESYDPTRLFVYPIRFQTIFAANVVGSLFELSTLLFVPILVGLLVATATSPLAFLVGTVLLLLFLLQTIATAQALTLLLIGVLKSRRFRDILTVLIPLIALSRYLLTPRFGQGDDIGSLLNSPFWRLTDFLPPGWTATAMTAAQGGDYLRTLEYALPLLLVAAVSVSAAAQILQQLFSGDRGTSLSVTKAKNAAIRPEPAVSQRTYGPDGARGEIRAIAEKELKYLVREPQYKALGMNIIYVVVVMGISFSRGGHGASPLFQTGDSSGDVIQPLIRHSIPIFITAIVLLLTMRLTFNIFGGEGAAITMLFSFPMPRRYIIVGKNLAYGSIVFLIELILVSAVSALTGTLTSLPVYIVWIVMATLVVLAAGNLVSVYFPTKFVMRGGLMSRGGQISVGASRSPGAGFGYMLLYLACGAAACVAEIPAAGAVILPSVGLISPIWYLVTIPFGVVYSAGLYYLSLKLIDTWMITRELSIIAKLAPGD